MTAPLERRDAKTIIDESRASLARFTQLLDELSASIDDLETEARRQRRQRKKWTGR